MSIVFGFILRWFAPLSVGNFEADLKNASLRAASLRHLLANRREYFSSTNVPGSAVATPMKVEPAYRSRRTRRALMTVNRNMTAMRALRFSEEK